MKEAEKAHLLEIESGLREFDFPPQVVIETTALCNFRCIHCNHKDLKRTKGSMDEALFQKIIDEIVRINPETEIWPTFYGEAFILGDRLFERLKYTNARGAKNVVLNSNGSLLHHKDWTDKVLTSGLKRFILSLDGFSKTTFEAIRVGGHREQIYNSVERLLNRKTELQLDYPIIQCQFSLMEQNKHEFEEFKQYWEERGAEVKSRNMLSWTNSGPVIAAGLDYNSDFRITCPWSLSTMAIHYNGDIVACAVDYEGGFIAGNARNQSLQEVWQGTLHELRTRQKQHQWQLLPNICQNCPDWQAAGASYYESQQHDVLPKYSRPFWFDISRRNY